MNPVIQLRDIQKVYHTGEVDVHAVRGVTLAIQPGEFVAVMGASGSGKSTLMNIVGCLDRATEGIYLLDDTDVSQVGRDELADIRNRKIGFIFQGFNLLSRTSALENVQLPMLYVHRHMTGHEQRERAVRCLEIVGLAERADHHPNQLSGGQQQRVAMGVFQKLNDEGITIVMVTHELDIARYTKRTVVMRDGRVLTDALVSSRLKADEELGRLREAQQAIQLAP